MFAAGFGVVALAATMSWFGVNDLLGATREVRSIHERLETFDALLVDLVDVETSARGFVISGQESYLEPYHRAAAAFPEHVRRLYQLFAGDPLRFAQLAELLQLEAHRLARSAEVVRLRREAGADAARSLVANGHGHELMQQARGVLAKLRAGEAARLAQLTGWSDRSALRALELTLGSAVAMALLVLIGTLVLTRSITLPLGRLARAAMRISQGEWPAIARERNDEIGDLADALSAMARARREVEERMRMLIDHAPDAFLIADLEGRYIDVNLAACELLGYQRDELVGKTIMDLIPSEDVPRLFAVRKALMVAGTVDVSEWSLLRKDGTRVPVEVSAKILGDGRWQAFGRDISERKRAQVERERLLEREREGRQRLQAIREAVLAISPLATRSIGKTIDALHAIVDQARQLTHADFAGLRVGTERDRPFDPWVWSGLSEAEAVAIGARLQPGGALAGPTGHDRALRIEQVGGSPEDTGAPPGELAVEALLTMPIRRKGVAIGSLSIAKRPGAPPFTSEDREIVELLVAHAAVAIENAKLYDELQAAVAAREDLLAIVSHDLRSPLNAILLREDVLARKRGSDRDLTEHARWVRRSIGNMHRMIQALLDVASLDAGRLALKLEASDVREVVDEVVDALAPIAAEAGIALECRVPDRHVARFDRERVAQVVYNLVGNAVKFTPPGGRITIAAEASADELHVSVTDTGRGIEPEVLPHVFERYFTTEHGGRGTGLGLHIARGIIEAHGGRIWVSSTLGEGATFHFTIPTQPAVPEEADLATPVNHGRSPADLSADRHG